MPPFAALNIKKEESKKINYLLTGSGKIRSIIPKFIDENSEIETAVHTKYILSINGELVFANVKEVPPRYYWYLENQQTNLFKQK